MMNNSIFDTCFYYPTSAVFLDDNSSFLEGIAIGAPKNLLFQTFTEPTEALKHIKENNHANQLLKTSLSAITDSQDYGVRPQNCETKLDLSALHKQIYHANRFNEVTVLVVDYAMPDINGLAFCEQIKALNIPLKIILLTGEADEKLAVKAFNEGTIHQFITKNSADFENMVFDSIFRLQREYFKEWSSSMLGSLLVQEDCALNNPAYVQKFHEVCKTHNIVEHYVLESTGATLLLDAGGNPFWLVAVKNTMFNDHIIVAQENDAPADVIKQLENRDVLAYFLDGENFVQTADQQWKEHIFPAKPVDESKSWYYAVIEDMPFFGLNKTDIVSFRQHLGNI